MLVILPCAGFGTRMNLQPNESKELLLDPVNNEPIINWHLEKIKDKEKLVITRKEKQDLIQYLDTAIEIIEPTGEWPSTILQSEKHWKNKNVLILSDTRWSLGQETLPEDVYSQIEKELETNQIVFAIHEVEDIRLWGKVFISPFSGKVLSTQEKPNIEFKLKGMAWGLIGFRKEIGKTLFEAYEERRVLDLSKVKTSVIKLDKFQDITRNGKVEVFNG